MWRSTKRDAGGDDGAAPAAGPSLKARAVRLLARRDYTRAELAQRLAPHAPDAAALQVVLDECQKQGWLDERRAVESHLRRRAGQWGAARVQAELRARGVEGDALQVAGDALRATEVERARAVWQRRFGAPPADPAERARQMRFLAARGFASDVVRRVVPPVAGQAAAGDEGDG
jgi:regulatory protein